MKAPQLPSFSTAPFLSDWLTFDTPGLATVRTGKVEIGQGILTALGQMAAEELGIAPDRIRLISGRTDCTPDEGYTAGSLSVVTSGAAIRAASAHARGILIARFAARLGCRPSEVSVSNGELTAGLLNETSSYWLEYHVEDFHIPVLVPKPSTNHQRHQWIGKPSRRIDLPAKLSSGAFIHDLDFPNMLHAHAVRGSVQAIDEAKLENLRSRFSPGACFIQQGRFLAVYSTSEKLTRRVSEVARQELFPDPIEPEHPAKPENFPSRLLHTTTHQMDGDNSLRNSAGVVRSRYSRPYLSHGSIGPSCAIAHFDGTDLQVWTHSQGVFPLRSALARLLKLDPARVVVQHVQGAGCYGHNGADGVACDAAIVALHAPGRHVRVQWTRRDELRSAPCGPASLVQIEAGVDHQGLPTSWSIEIWSPTHVQRPGSRGAVGLLGAEEINSKANKVPPGDVPLERGGGGTRNGFAIYRLPTQKLTHHLVEDPGVRTSAIRGLGAHANVFAIESFIDELAAAASIDPLDYRLSLLDDERAKAVLLKVADMAGWSSRPRSTEGTGFGIAFSRYKNIAAYAAIIAQVDLSDSVRVPRIWCCVDAGLVINPDGAVNQIEGGIIQSTSWTLKESFETDIGELPQRWEDYPILRFSEVPEVSVTLIKSSSEVPLGIGEVAVGPTSAAIGNAVAGALGQRMRTLPFTTDRLATTLLNDDADGRILGQGR